MRRLGEELFRRRSTDQGAAPDILAAMERLVRYQRPQERSAEVLRSLRAHMPHDVRGYVVSGDEASGFKFDAQVGYNDALLGLVPANGPWRSPGPRPTSR